MPLECVWHEEQFYTVPQNVVCDLADGKSWISMLLTGMDLSF